MYTYVYDEAVICNLHQLLGPSLLPTTPLGPQPAGKVTPQSMQRLCRLASHVGAEPAAADANFHAAMPASNNGVYGPEGSASPRTLPTIFRHRTAVHCS